MIFVNNYPLVITVTILLILIGAYVYFEKSSKGIKEIALIGTMSAFAAVCRVPFAAIPGVQPTTFIVALQGFIFGPVEGFITGSSAAFISNIFLGQGPWTPWQMFSWGLVGFISGFIGKKSPKMKVETFSTICFFYGFLFDWIMNLWHVLGFIRPLTVNSILLAYMTGLSIDIMHSCGNFIFSMIFFTSFSKVLIRFKEKLTVVILKI